jgi:hypothetical protein
MAVKFINQDFETLRSWKLMKKDTGEYCFNIFYPIDHKPVGTLLMDFVEAEYHDFSSFCKFVDTLGLAGLFSLSASAQKVFQQHNGFSEEEYKQVLQSIWEESSDNLEEIQKEFIEAVYFCLDLDGPAWTKGLEPIKRFFLASGRLFIPNIKRYADLLREDFIIEPVSPNFDMVKLITSKLTDAEYANIMKENTFEVVDEFSSGSIAGICYAEFKRMLVNGFKARKCKHCGRYFTPSKRIDAEYCDRAFITSSGIERTCKEIGPMRKYASRLKKDPIIEAYRKAYKVMHARLTARGKKRISEDAFKIWKSNAEAVMSKVKAGEISFKEFQNWINESKGGKD